MKNMKRLMALILVIVMVGSMALSFAACGSKDQIVNGTVVLKDGKTYGSGKTDFKFEVKGTDGKAVTVTVKTDKETVGEALIDNQLVAGSVSEWGLYVETVNGVTLNWDKDQKYWAFYENGEYAQTGVDATPIVAGATYTLAAE